MGASSVTIVGLSAATLSAKTNYIIAWISEQKVGKYIY
jgi:hypothetical protein